LKSNEYLCKLGNLAEIVKVYFPISGDYFNIFSLMINV